MNRSLVQVRQEAQKNFGFKKQNVFHKSYDIMDFIRNLNPDCDTFVLFPKIQKNVFFECKTTSKHSKSNTKSVKIKTSPGFDVSDFDDCVSCNGICTAQSKNSTQTAC